MPIEVKVPPAGESVTEAILAKWLKKDGDYVKADEPIVEMETDKASQEIPAPVAGTLRTAVSEGTTVPVGGVIGRIEERGAGSPADEPKANWPGAAADSPQPRPPANPAPKGAALSPSARVLAQSKGIDPQKLAGSGRGGRIIKQDVVGDSNASRGSQPLDGNGTPAVGESPPINTPVAPSGRETRERMSGIRQRIAARLVESQQKTASLTTFNEADLHAVNELRARYKESFKEKHGVSLGYTSFFVKATVEALKAFPIVNARIEGAEIVHQHFYDIGVAVSTERGLMVPVLRDADQMSFSTIEKSVAEMAAKARGGKIAVADLQGGTFTITNGGVFGSLLSTPILNPPQTAILGLHAIQKRPVVRDDQIVIRPMMYLALTYDHRLIDGRDAVQFLVRIKDGIENPERLMLEI
jgi:2-oxoglutarate dehydrogenase E2 component (dihydrolipoamide succinyltransferase)